MCALCGVLLSSHWAEQGNARHRIERVRLVNHVVAHFGLRLDDWAGRTYVLRDAKGKAEVVLDLGSLWQAAERLIGRRLDPLDPELIATLG
jgi:hypothetical protein